MNELDDQEENFLNVMSALEEIYESNPHAANIWKQLIFNNPSKTLNKSSQRVYNSFFELDKNEQWFCNHKGCTSTSIYSHELSKNRIQNFLGEKQINGKIIVDILAPDLKDNAYKFHFKETPTKSATSFLGYCKDHDEDIFSDLDKTLNPNDNYLLNKQYLRTLRRKIYELDIQIKIRDLNLIELLDIKRKESSKYINDMIEATKSRIANLNKQRSHILCLYEKIQSGLESQNLAVATKKYKIEKQEYMFSDFFDITNKNDSDYYIFFLLKEEFKSDSFFFVGTFKNSYTKKIFDDFDIATKEGRCNATRCMLESKDKFIFSPSFKYKLAEAEKMLFCKDPKFEYIPDIDIYIIESILFSNYN